MANFKSRITALFAPVPDNAKGVGLMLSSAGSISAANGAVQYLSHSIHVFEIAFFRQLLGVIFMSVVFLRGGLRPLFTQKIGLHLLRAVLNVGAMLAFFYGLSLEPLAKVVSLGLTSPLFATVGAVIFLRERMTPHRWIALAIGVAGALIILRPGVQVVSIGALMVLVSNMLWASALVVIKVLTRTDSSVTVALYASLLQAPIAFVFALFFWQWPTGEQLAWLAFIAIFGTLSQLALTEAFRKADATLVLPADFTKVIWASMIGYFFFNQIPEIWIGIGAVVIFSAVFYNTYSDSRSPDVDSSKP
ncbi:MAG: RNA polymerase subunit sigma-54 [Rhodospirillaceae bacterium]|nr:RNA polymerase subunit sigma-54 [Rhodospirillaceae bacterium]|tara:strand:+ start:7946 stop:8860 length:915 start_codon:yes stop_codon:yes gene_type:complete